MPNYQIHSSWLSFEPCHIHWKQDETWLNIIINTKASGAGKGTTTCQACLMTLSIRGERKIRDAEDSGILQTSGEILQRACNASPFKEGDDFIVLTESQGKAQLNQSWKWLFLLKECPETLDIAQSCSNFTVSHHTEESLLSFLHFIQEELKEKHRYIKRKK